MTLSGASLAAQDRSVGQVGQIGLQLYTVRNEMEKDFEGTLARVAEIGYRQVEFAGYYGRSPRIVKAILEKNGLKSPSSHIPLDSFEKELTRTLATAKTIGQTYLVCPWLAEASRKSLDDYKRLAETFNRIAAQVEDAGFKFAYHNHNFEFTPLEGQIPFETLMKGTDPKLVNFEMDLYWVERANQDPVKYLEANIGRVPLAHVKDMARGPERSFADVGSGTMDFKTIFQACEKAGVKYYIVEHDKPENAFDSIKNSLDYLRSFKF